MRIAYILILDYYIPRSETLPTSGHQQHRDRAAPPPQQPAAPALSPWELDPPAYQVEHLTSFECGRQFGIQSPADGIRWLKQMERNSAVWSQPMLLTLQRGTISVVDEHGVCLIAVPHSNSV